MLAPIEWLKQLVDVPENIHDFCNRLTLSGSKVEGVTWFGEDVSGVVTGRIETIERHPNADKLVICQVNVGEQKNLQIVTGASNVKVNDIVPVALDGSHVNGGKQINTGMLRGVKSEGMLCSLAELGIMPELFPEAVTDGIFILPDDLALGEPVLKALKLEGGTIEFEITSNRPDCYSIEGLAREAAITYRHEFHLPEPEVKADGLNRTSDALKVTVAEPALCSRYCAVRIDKVKIEPSPLWMRRRLAMSGVRPINNIVDITNYVMLELGQPMHAFSADCIRGGEITVRRAAGQETFTTLDDKKYVLDDSMLVIADKAGAVALAGIMGGANSCINPGTDMVIFEAACFAPDSVRQTASALGIRTESSARFERIVDGWKTLRALKRACELVEKLGCGLVSSDFIDINNLPSTKPHIKLDFNRVNTFLGLQLATSEMIATLEAVGCNLTVDSGNLTADVVAPSFRPDLEGFADLAEEVARFHDYNNIPPTLLPAAETTVGGRSTKLNIKRLIAEIMISSGFYEAYTYSFMSAKEPDRLGLAPDSPLRKMLKIRYAPEDTSCLRTTPLPALLNIAHNNSSRAEESAGLFEIMRCYHPVDGQKLPNEREVVAAIVYENTTAKDNGRLFYELKHIVEEISQQTGIKDVEFLSLAASSEVNAPAEAPCFHPYRSASLVVNRKSFGLIGYLHPDIAETYDLPRCTAVLLLDLATVVELHNFKRTQKPLPKYPAVTRDLAVVVDRSTPVGEIEKNIYAHSEDLLAELALFDVYEGKNLGHDKKSVAFSLKFRSQTGTLNDAAINPIMNRIIEALHETLHAELRQ